MIYGHEEALTWQAIHQRGLNVIFLFCFFFVATIVNVPNVLFIRNTTPPLCTDPQLDDHHSLFGGIVYFIEHFYNCVHKN